jgi:hypothetical protein
VSEKYEVSFTAATSAYLVLSGVWLAFGFLCEVFAWRSPPGSGWHEAAALCFGIGALWVAWIRGFRIRFNEGVFEYRDGFYRCTSIAFVQIRGVRKSWIEWKLLGRHLRVPRLVVDYGQGDSLAINMKPFKSGACVERSLMVVVFSREPLARVGRHTQLSGTSRASPPPRLRAVTRPAVLLRGALSLRSAHRLRGKRCPANLSMR